MHSPWCLGFGLDAPHTLAAGVWGGGVAGWPGEEEAGAGSAAAGEFPKVIRVSLFFHFFFLRKSSCSILPVHTRKGLSSHTAHLSSYTWDCLGQGPTRSNSQLSPADAHSLCGFTQFVFIPLHATSSNQVSLGAAQALFGRGGSH